MNKILYWHHIDTMLKPQIQGPRPLAYIQQFCNLLKIGEYRILKIRYEEYRVTITTTLNGETNGTESN